MKLIWSHERVREELSAYLDDVLEPEERERVEAHLAGCDACRADLEGMRETRALLRSLPQVSVPRSFAITEAMAAGVPPAPLVLPPRASRFGALRYATAALAACFVAALMVNLVGYSTPVIAPSAVIRPTEAPRPAPSSPQQQARSAAEVSPAKPAAPLVAPTRPAAAAAAAPPAPFVAPAATSAPAAAPAAAAAPANPLAAAPVAATSTSSPAVAAQPNAPPVPAAPAAAAPTTAPAAPPGAAAPSQSAPKPAAAAQAAASQQPLEPSKPAAAAAPPPPAAVPSTGASVATDAAQTKAADAAKPSGGAPVATSAYPGPLPPGAVGAPPGGATDQPNAGTPGTGASAAALVAAAPATATPARSVGSASEPPRQASAIATSLSAGDYAAREVAPPPSQPLVPTSVVWGLGALTAAFGLGALAARLRR